MSAAGDLPRLLAEAAVSMKRDVKGAIAKLEAAYGLARATGVADDAAVVAEELARAWGRRRSSARALYYARKAASLSPGVKGAWATLGKTCELVASRTAREHDARVRALYRAAADAFAKAAKLASDPEDARWLAELARDAARAAKPPKPSP